MSETDCFNNPGPTITLEGVVTLGGLQTELIFEYNLKGTHQAVAYSDVEIIPNGATVTIPKQPVLGGSGGNPWILLQFQQSDGTDIGDPFLLGRCVQL